MEWIIAIIVLLFLAKSNTPNFEGGPTLSLGGTFGGCDPSTQNCGITAGSTTTITNAPSSPPYVPPSPPVKGGPIVSPPSASRVCPSWGCGSTPVRSSPIAYHPLFLAGILRDGATAL